MKGEANLLNALNDYVDTIAAKNIRVLAKQ